MKQHRRHRARILVDVDEWPATPRVDRWEEACGCRFLAVRFRRHVITLVWPEVYWP